MFALSILAVILFLLLLLDEMTMASAFSTPKPWGTSPGSKRPTTKPSAASAVAFSRATASAMLFKKRDNEDKDESERRDEKEEAAPQPHEEEEKSAPQPHNTNIPYPFNMQETPQTTMMALFFINQNIADLKADIADLKGDIGKVETSLKGDIGKVETSLKGDINQIYTVFLGFGAIVVAIVFGILGIANMWGEN
jgi:hypothetical protein